jgi:hypothetical protein
MYEKNRLTRKDLLVQIKGIWELVEDHSVKCSYETIRSLLLETGRKKNNETSKMLNTIINYEFQLRALTVEKGVMDPEMLDFLFGKPLSETLANMIRQG